MSYNIVVNRQLKSIASGGSADLVPIGSVFSYIGTKAPKGYLLCDGATYKRNQYPELWEILKDIPECKGDGSTTFTTPNYTDSVKIIKAVDIVSLDTYSYIDDEKTDRLHTWSSAETESRIIDNKSFKGSILTSANDCIPTEANSKSFYSVFGSNTPETSVSWHIEAYKYNDPNTSNIYVMQTAQRISSSVSTLYSRDGISSDGGTTWTWTNWEKLATETNINGIIYNEFIDDLNLNYLSGSNFLQKHLPNLFTGGVFYSLEMTAIEKNTGKYVRVIYNCKRETSASYKIKEENGLSVSAINQFGTVAISGNTNKLIQKTKVLAIVQNGTYIPLT